MALLSLLAATSAMAQVQVDVRLDKTRYLAGEPVVVFIDVRNVGDEAVGYSSCDANVHLVVTGAERRVRPDISGCFSGMVGGGFACGTDHPPLLQPGQTTTFRYLLQEYDLRPGQYQLTASGKAGVRSKETDPVSGAQFDRTVSLNIVASTERELRAALAPLISNADATEAVQRYQARAALNESAPPFLESLIARFAIEDEYTSAIDALARIDSKTSRTHLKNLFPGSREARRSAIVLAVASAGHRDDADFLDSVLQDETIDRTSRGYAALGLGRIGGDQAVQRLKRALVTPAPEVRPSIAVALGNTQSRAAVPVLIGMFGNNTSRNEVCGALKTLTHRAWCEGSELDAAATRRHWLRWWNENRSKTSIFGPCAAEPSVQRGVPQPASTVQGPAPSRPPRVSKVVPTVAAPNSVLAVSGYALGVEDRRSVHVFFRKGTLERTARIGSSSGRVVSPDPDNEFQSMDVIVPADLTPGRWELVIDANGRRSSPVLVEIRDEVELQLAGISPPTPHPSQVVRLKMKAAARNGDQVQLTDARGQQWRIGAGVSSLGITLWLPDEVADGEANVRIRRNVNGAERLSAPLRFFITSGPLPLKPDAVAGMAPVAPGQWTDLVKDVDIEFEVMHADRIDVEFKQGNVVEVSRTTGPENVHVRVPARLKPGDVSVRTRTWIGQTASEWSAPTTFRLLERDPMPPLGTAPTSPRVVRQRRASPACRSRRRC